MTTEPEIRPGLPRHAARRAWHQGERLVHGEALLDARENPIPETPRPRLEALRSQATKSQPTVEVDSTVLRTLINEVEALRLVAAHRLELLEDAADAEARRFDLELRSPLVRLNDDAYVPWSDSADSPAGWVMTEAEALERGWTRKRLDRAAGPDEDGFLYNRSGPREAPLTVAAMLEAYASPAARQAFRLTPDKVLCYTTNETWRNEQGEWEQGPVYWKPWHPGEAPDSLPSDWKDRF